MAGYIACFSTFMLKAKFDQIAEGNSNEGSGMSRYLLEAQLVFVFFPLYYNRLAEGGVFEGGGVVNSQCTGYIYVYWASSRTLMGEGFFKFTTC